MHSWLRWRSLVVGGAAVLAFVAAPRFLAAQAPVKRPLSYDTYDYWRSISGTRLSRDGQWLAYALTSQGEDGDLVVRNLKTGKDYHAARGTSPVFTPDGRLVIFTIAPPKADEPREAGAAASEAPATPQPTGRAGSADAARTSMGIMTLADGKVTAIDRVAQFRLPDESATWLAYHRPGATGRGSGGRAGAGGAGRGGAARGAAGGAPPTATSGSAASETASAAVTPEKRKDPGSELVVRNLATGEEITIAEVTDFQWNKDGSWLAYAVSAVKPAGDGAFARKMADGSTVALHQGRGHYNNLAFDQAGRQLAFLSDTVEYEKNISPYRLYFWKAGDPAATELVSAATKGMPPGMAVSEYGGVRFSDDGARLYLGTAPPPPPPADPKAPKPIQVDLWNYHDLELQPMQQVRAQQARQQNFRAVVHLADHRFVQLAAPDLPTVNPR